MVIAWVNGKPYYSTQQVIAELKAILACGQSDGILKSWAEKCLKELQCEQNK